MGWIVLIGCYTLYMIVDRILTYKETKVKLSRDNSKYLNEHCDVTPALSKAQCGTNCCTPNEV